MCNEEGAALEIPSMKSTDTDPCKCGRRDCLCNKCDEDSQELAVINFPEFHEKEGTSKTSTTQVEKSNRTGDGKSVFEGILPKCEICKTDCSCWEHKIEMSKQFIDESRFKLKYRELKQDKACETEKEADEKVKQLKKFCIICGHHDCNCDGPQQKQNCKYFKHLEFDDNTIETLLIEKEKSLKAIKSLTSAEKISTSLLQKRILEHNELDVCCTKETDKIEGSNHKQTVAMNKVMNTKMLPPKKIYITPEQRAKNITSTHRTILGRGKFGIPQLMRYADGRFAPKPAKSQDILSKESSDHNYG